MRELVIDTGKARTVGELHGLLAGALGFPGYYGRNLAALEDCLGDLARPTRITLLRRPAAQPAGTGPGDPGGTGDPDGTFGSVPSLSPGRVAALVSPLDRPLTNRYLDLLAGTLLRSASENPALDVRLVDGAQAAAPGELPDDPNGNSPDGARGSRSSQPTQY